MEKRTKPPVQNIQSLSAEEQMILFISDIFQKAGSTTMANILNEGKSEYMVEVYKLLHHTAPDTATLAVIERSIPRGNVPIPT
jgi:hypothetical protein